jgi:hypothetical protein
MGILLVPTVLVNMNITFRFKPQGKRTEVQVLPGFCVLRCWRSLVFGQIMAEARGEGEILISNGRFGGCLKTDEGKKLVIKWE